MWINFWLWNKDPQKKMQADYKLLNSLNITMEEEWKLKENKLLLLIEERGLEIKL